jgi:hypothetical protein
MLLLGFMDLDITTARLLATSISPQLLSRGTCE